MCRLNYQNEVVLDTTPIKETPEPSVPGLRRRRRVTNTLTMARDIEKMVAIGLVWGATNALIRRGALLWDQRSTKLSSSSSSSSSPPSPPKLRRRLISSIKNLLRLLLFWQYSIPFLLNLLASATFFALLSHAPISLAVPVTNATTFAATAAFGILLGEKIRIRFALLGTGFIVIGIWLCIT